MAEDRGGDPVGFMFLFMALEAVALVLTWRWMA